jgi:hypothetical protein
VFLRCRSVIRARLLARSETTPTPNDDGSDGSRDTLTGRCETFDCDGCGHDGHRAKVQEKGDRPLFPGFVQPAEPAERLFEAQKGDRSIFRLSA